MAAFEHKTKRAQKGDGLVGSALGPLAGEPLHEQVVRRPPCLVLDEVSLEVRQVRAVQEDAYAKRIRRR